MYKHLYSKFFEKNPNIRHFACHSHHYWPDCTRDAQLQYWEDSAKYVDDKWGYFFSHKVPEFQKYVAESLNLTYPEQITIAPNTHELVARLMSSFGQKKIKVLTTDCEFYSFDRQLKRLYEEEMVDVNIVPLEPLSTFEERLMHEAGRDHDFTFFSHVFFNQGYRIQNLQEIVEVAAKHSVVCVDLYHSFFAIPTSLKEIEDKAFFVGGCYKYSMGGEGASFLISPKNTKIKPVNTGWFAQIDSLSDDSDNEVYFSNSGLRFAGATVDFSGLYRQVAVFEMLKANDISVGKIHSYVKDEQKKFLEQINLKVGKLVYHGESNQGHFICIKYENSDLAAEAQQRLKEQKIITDRRGDIIRFGFCLYTEGPYNFVL